MNARQPAPSRCRSPLAMAQRMNGGRPAYSGRRIPYTTGPEGECKAASALGGRSPLAVALRMNAGRVVFTGRADEGVLA